jgi:hypothetical protein
MAGLSVKGDPHGWLDAGRSVSTLMTQLESELSEVNTVTGQGLTRSWFGPAASAFAANWSTRRSRYEDLIYHARRAAQAITDYGEKLLGMAQQAAYLESYWCGFGLHILETGENFILPPGVASMPPGTQLSLHQALSESRTAVERLASDALGAAEDLAVALGSVIAALKDFQLIELGVLVGAADYVSGQELQLDHVIHNLIDLAEHTSEYAMKQTKLYASQLGHDLRVGLPEQRSTAGRFLRSAARDARNAASIDHAAKLASHAVLVGEAVYLGAQIIGGIPREGFLGSIESHSGDIASLALTPVERAAGVAIAGVVLAGAPEAVVIVGGVVIGSVVAIGVSYTVQSVVDHRKAIGHFIESAF